MKFYIFADFNVNSSTYNWQLVHAPENFPEYIYGSPIEEDKAFAYNISMEKEISRAGSLSFTIPPRHPLYNSIIPLGTTIALTTAESTPSGGEASQEEAVIGHVLWIGRVLTVERNFNLEKNISCEGALAFLNDIMVRPRSFFTVSGENANKEHKVPAVDILQMIYNEYNSRCSVKRRLQQFRLQVPEETIDSTQTPLYDGDSEHQTYEHSGSMIPATLGCKASYNGTAYIFNGERYWETYEYPQHYYINETYYTSIDDYVTTFDKFSEIVDLDPSVGMWAECTDDYSFEITLFVARLPYTHKPKHIIFANNLVDLQDNGDGMELYSQVIPLGANKMRLGDDPTGSPVQYIAGNYQYWPIVSDYIRGSDTSIGIIEKTIDYSDATTSDELGTIAFYNLQAYESRIGRSYNVSAVDISLLSENQDEGYNPFILSDGRINSSDYNPNNFIDITDGVMIESLPHGTHYSNVKFTCSSLRFNVDNPGASDYTFQIYDNSYVPSKPKMLTEFYARQKAISEGKVAQDGTIYYQNRQPKDVYKEDDNNVYADYDQYQEHYSSTGTGDARTDITSEKVAPGTYVPPQNNS
ncbi:MAG: hypothetical protein J6U54_09780 [Clostridiales bacterium]|nr:hypothetical protein [Clostridiales bacterium]